MDSEKIWIGVCVIVGSLSGAVTWLWRDERKRSAEERKFLRDEIRDMKQRIRTLEEEKSSNEIERREEIINLMTTMSKVLERIGAQWEHRECLAKQINAAKIFPEDDKDAVKSDKLSVIRKK
jgi:septal ring factor EnvC (AmiA/AmiB activator)